MESTSDKGTTGASRAYLLGTIDEVRRILDDPSIPEKDVDGLEAVLFNILTAVTPTELGDLLSKRLVAIAEKSPNELAAIANPAVQLLKRRPLGREHPEASQFKILLAGSDAYPLEEIGELILEENPYYENTDGILTEAQITAAQTAARRGGPFQFFNTLSTWEAGKPGPSMTFPRIPHPGDAPPPGFERSWYMVTKRTPKSLNDDITMDPDRARARNIVKTVEIEYGREDALGNIIPIDTGEDLAGGAPKLKTTHIFIMYAGGNGS